MRISDWSSDVCSSDRKSAGVAPGALGRQDVIGAGAFVAEGHGGFLAEEERAIVGKVLQPPVAVLCLHLQVLRSIAVGDLDGFFPAVPQHHLAFVAPGGRAGRALRFRKSVEYLRTPRLAGLRPPPIPLT